MSGLLFLKLQLKVKQWMYVYWKWYTASQGTSEDKVTAVRKQAFHLTWWTAQPSSRGFSETSVNITGTGESGVYVPSKTLVTQLFMRVVLRWPTVFLRQWENLPRLIQAITFRLLGLSSAVHEVHCLRPFSLETIPFQRTEWSILVGFLESFTLLFMWKSVLTINMNIKG